MFTTPISNIEIFYPLSLCLSLCLSHDHTLCNNYQPISLLSNISEIIERLVHKRLTKFLNMNDMLYKKPFGFRHDHSTTHALLEVTKKIRLANNNEKYSCGVFLDLKKAFHTVNHKKLEIYGISGITIKQFKSFLKDRKDYTTIQRNPAKT